jgi:hypothetical protein
MLTELETTLLGVMMMVIMLGMGSSMTYRDFLIAFRRPKGILVGLLSQYLIMPFLGYALALLLGLPPAMAAGLILIACMPGGTTSNVFTYFSKGVLALSIMMTTVSTLVAVVTVPLLLSFYGGLAGLSGDYVIPAGNVAQVLVVLLVPTVIGMGLRKLNANIGATVELIGSMLGVAVILFLIGSWVPRNYQMLLSGLCGDHRHWPDGHALGLLAGPGLRSRQQPRPHDQSGNRHPERASGGLDHHAHFQWHDAARGSVHSDPLQPVHRHHLLADHHLVSWPCHDRGAGPRRGQGSSLSTASVTSSKGPATAGPFACASLTKT